MDRLRLWLLSILLALSVLFFVRFSSTLEMFFFAVGLSYIMMPAVNWVERLLHKRKEHSEKLGETAHKGSRGLAVFMVMIFTLLFIGTAAGIVIPYLGQQISGLISDFPAIQAELQRWLGIIESYLAQMNLPTKIMVPLSNFFSQLDTYLVSLALNIVAWLAEVSSGLLNLVIVFILQIYFLMDGPRIIRMGRDYMLENGLHRVAGFLRTSARMINQYIKTQALIAGIMALVAFVGLKILGVRYASLFAVLLFFLDFIPYIGAIAGSLIIIGFALFTEGVRIAVFTGIFMLVLQQVEGNVIQPKLQGKTVGVHAAIIMLSLLVCSELWGAVGMLFSVVIAGMVKLLLADSLEYLLHPEVTLTEFLRTGYEEEAAEPAEPAAEA